MNPSVLLDLDGVPHIVWRCESCWAIHETEIDAAKCCGKGDEGER